MQIQVRERDDVAIAELQGRLVSGVGDRQLRDLLDSLLADERKKIVLDLSSVSAIDSAGIGELVAGLRVAQELGAGVKILQMSDRVKHVLHLGQILPLFEVFEDEDAAVASFGKPV